MLKWRAKLAVGERGIQISGGQNKELPLLEHSIKSKILILEIEATSALDTKTESDVMNSINTLTNELTVIIIAHRISTLKQCDEVYEIKSAKLKR